MEVIYEHLNLLKKHYVPNVYSSFCWQWVKKEDLLGASSLIQVTKMVKYPHAKDFEKSQRQ
jgi:hypothetical protein